MPKLFAVGRYVIFFWSSEENEPVHVHIAIKRASADSVKVWLTEDGGCILANDNKIIPNSNINRLLDFVQDNHEDICDQWKAHFKRGLKFYC